MTDICYWMDEENYKGLDTKENNKISDKSEYNLEMKRYIFLGYVFILD